MPRGAWGSALLRRAITICQRITQVQKRAKTEAVVTSYCFRRSQVGKRARQPCNAVAFSCVNLRCHRDLAETGSCLAMLCRVAFFLSHLRVDPASEVNFSRSFRLCDY